MPAPSAVRIPKDVWRRNQPPDLLLRQLFRSALSAPASPEGRLALLAGSILSLMVHCSKDRLEWESFDDLTPEMSRAAKQRAWEIVLDADFEYPGIARWFKQAIAHAAKGL